ncbi:MAG TPA: hypothetical protein VFT27_02150 [Actinomycetota bacterium]|nr:hypothetical protein [Actinomycetota bacterium]
MWWADEGPARVTARIVEGRLVVRASRRGTSLSAEEASRLFEPRAPGTGAGSKIGLWVALGVAEVQGGSVGVEIDGGVSFVLDIPNAEVPG